MLRKKRTICALIALVLSVCMLASCSGGTNGSTETKKIELEVWNTQGTSFNYKPPIADSPGDWLTEQTGVSINNIYGNDDGQWDAKLTKLYVGGNLPDIVWCQSAQGPAHFNKLDELEVLADLDEALIKKHAPNVWKRVPSYIWDMFKTSDGRILGIPFKISSDNIETVLYDQDPETLKNLVSMKGSQTSGVQTNLYVRDDVLKEIYPECMSYDEIIALMEEKQAPIGDELMDIPIHSTEEFIDFMYKIKDMNLVEDGRKVYAFGYGGDAEDNWEALVYLGNAMYGSNWHQYTAHWNTKTNKVEIPLMGDLVKQMAKTQNQMILDKVIDPESLAHTKAQFQAKVFQGVYAICSAVRAGSLDSINKQLELNGAKFRYRPFWIDIPNPEGYDPFKVATSFQESLAILNTLSEDEVIQVLKWIDLQFTDEFMQIQMWGTPEDGFYTEDENGVRSFNDERFVQWAVYGKKADDVGIKEGETKNILSSGNMRINPLELNPYSPDFVAGYTRITPTVSTGFKFDIEGKFVQSVKPVPPSYAYSSEFGSLPELVAYWARRGEWETAIKKAIAAEEGKFEAKWEEMRAIVEGVCDYKKMEEEMTKIAMPYYETILASQEK